MMRTIALVYFCVVPLIASAGEEFSFDALTVGVGRSLDAVDVQRVGLRHEFVVARRGGAWMAGYYEASASAWERDDTWIYCVSLSPVFTCNFGSASGGRYAYMEGGVGVAAITGLEFGRRELSSHLLFEDRLGVGVHAGAVDLNFRYMHYSNAGLVPPNDGIDILMLTMAYTF